MNNINMLGIFGIIVSTYAIYIEKCAKQIKKYRATCDINSTISCSLVLKSRYSRLAELFFKLNDDSWFNVPNTYYGLLFYIGVTLYPMFPFTIIPFREILFFSASILSITMCVVLAYILYFKLKNLCVVCVTSYILNAIILMHAYKELMNYLNY